MSPSNPRARVKAAAADDSIVVSAFVHLRHALAARAEAREQIAAARHEEAIALATLRGQGLTYWRVACGLVPISDRRRVAGILRRRAWRMGSVPARDVKRTSPPALAPDRPGSAANEVPSSPKEDHMSEQRIISRTVITEEVFGPVDEDEDDVNDEGDGDDSDDEEDDDSE